MIVRTIDDAKVVDWGNGLSRRFDELAERATRIADHNARLERRTTRLTRENDELVVVNRRLIDENTRLRTTNNETRDRVEAEIADKIQSALDRSKSEDATSAVS